MYLPIYSPLHISKAPESILKAKLLRAKGEENRFPVSFLETHAREIIQNIISMGFKSSGNFEICYMDMWLSQYKIRRT